MKGCETLEEEPPSVDDTVSRAILALVSNVVPFAGAVIEPALVVYDDIRARRAHRTALALVAVADSVGGPDQLGQRLRDSPLHESQLVQGLEEAIRTGHEAKRRLLVRAVINSLENNELFDESQLIIDALGHLDDLHIRALARLGQEVDADGNWAIPLRSKPDGTVEPEDQSRGKGFSPSWASLPDPIQAALVRAGVSTYMQPTTIWPSRSLGPAEGINTFGRDLLANLRMEALTKQEPAGP